MRDPRIDDYIAKAQPFAQEILSHVRKRVHATLAELEEAMKWGMPAYLIGGKLVLITAGFKAHAALNFWRGQEIGDGNAKAGAMGQFGRLKSPEDLPRDSEVDALIYEAAALAKSAPHPRKSKSEPRPAPAMHPEFAVALERAPKAKAVFDGFSPSARCAANGRGRGARPAFRLYKWRSHGSAQDGGLTKFTALERSFPEHSRSH